MLFKKKYRFFFYTKLKKIWSNPVKKCLQFKNLKCFLKIDKCHQNFIKSEIGIKFLLNFRSKLIIKTRANNIKEIKWSFLNYHHANARLLLNHVIRYTNEKKNLKTNFFKNFPIKKTHSTKIYIEESADQIKTYLDEKLIRLVLKSNPLIGRCWLWVNSTTYNNKKFWYHLINSFFDFMTTIEQNYGGNFPIQDLNMMIKKINAKDYELEFSKLFRKKTTLFESYDQLKIKSIDITFFTGYYKSYTIKRYLKDLTWRNRVFQKKTQTLITCCLKIKNTSHSSYLLLF